MHTTAFVDESWEQTAFESHPPLLTVQLSIEWIRFYGEEKLMRMRIITFTDDRWITGTYVGITRFASTYYGVGCSIMRTNSILITSTIVYFATIFRENSKFQFLGKIIFWGNITCTDDHLTSTRVCITRLARTFNCVRSSIVWANSIGITSTIVYCATIYNVRS